MSLSVVPTSKELAEVKSQVLAVQQAAYKYVIKESSDLTLGENMLRTIKDIETGITLRKEEITRPLMKALSSARDLFKPLETGHAEAKKVIKEKMLAFQLEEDVRIREQQAKIEARVEKGTMRPDTAVGKLETITGARSKLNTRILRKLDIFDETALPREYLVPDRDAITKALFAGMVVPGAQLKEEKVLVTK